MRIKTRAKTLAVLALLILPMLLSMPAYGYVYTDIESNGFDTKSPTLYTTNVTLGECSAKFNLTFSPMQYLDFSERFDFNLISGWGDYDWHANCTIVFPNGFKITDIYETHVSWWGLWGDSIRRVHTIFPNGTAYIKDPEAGSSNFYDMRMPLRIIMWRDPDDKLNIVWTWSQYPEENIILDHIAGREEGPASWFTFDNTDWDITLTIYLYVKAEKRDMVTGFYVEYHKDQEVDYPLSFNPVTGEFFEERYTGDIWATLVAIGNAVSGGIKWFVDRVVEALGLQWLLNIINSIIQALVFIFSIVWAVLPYLGFIILIYIMTFVVKLDFVGLIDFFIWMYDILATIISAIVNFFTFVAQAIDTIVPL